MHEIGIANSILEATRQELARYPSAKPFRVGVRIGELAAVDPDALTFCFAAITRDTDMQGLMLEIEFCLRKNRCTACGAEFVVDNFEFQCPGCGGSDTEFLSGDQLELAYLEVDEHEPSAA
jgi:hydrogenase nickel incorporation protein HypA/HybF